MGEFISEFVNESLGFINDLFGGNADRAMQQVGIQVISTLLLFLVVRFFFWNKVTDYLEGRKAAMRQEYDDAKQANENAALKREEAVKELHDLRKSSKGILDEARFRSLEERKDILAKAKLDANKLVDDAHKEIDSQIEKAKKDINDEIVSVATLMAEQIIKKEIDETKHKELIKEISKEVAN
ncbi:ATP synthase subunit b [Candidatus Izimaplasma bacterium HR1]|jgi:F-type H+-transporting ATPase subunit b|uniref:F0F1 ATP synthase subunit B n=1 Tax=Candidatus Izimoplasma sp. HR1 TaxID=1541959 RepID=UPI0004F8FBC3|nr:ATP synthase subunit b [Candidatus Izimaplasma bacterium HR1]